MVDALGYLSRFILVPGQRHDSVGVKPLIENIDFAALIADKAFDNNALRRELSVAHWPSSPQSRVAKRPFPMTPRCKVAASGRELHPAPERMAAHRNALR